MTTDNFIVCNSICWNRCLLYAGSAGRNLSPSKLFSLVLIPPPPSLESVSRLPTKQRHTFFSISSQIRIWEEKRQTKKAHLEVIYCTDRVRAAACIMRQGKQHANTIHNASCTTVNKSNTALKALRSVGWETFFINSAFEPSEKQLRLFQGLWPKDRLMSVLYKNDKKCSFHKHIIKVKCCLTKLSLVPSLKKLTRYLLFLSKCKWCFPEPTLTQC